MDAPDHGNAGKFRSNACEEVCRIKPCLDEVGFFAVNYSIKLDETDCGNGTCSHVKVSDANAEFLEFIAEPAWAVEANDRMLELRLSPDKLEEQRLGASQAKAGYDM